SRGDRRGAPRPRGHRGHRRALPSHVSDACRCPAQRRKMNSDCQHVELVGPGVRPVFDLRSDRYAVALGYLAALGAVALVTALIALVVGRVPMANVSMFYLIAVLATAVVFGSGPAILASLA